MNAGEELSTVQRLLDAGSLTEAAARMEDALRRAPNDALFNARYANVLLRLRRFEEAHVRARRAIELAPDAASGYIQSAHTLLHMGCHADAQGVITEMQQRAVAADEAEWLDIQQALLTALEGQGRLAEAEAAARAIVARRPHAPESRRELARLLMRQKRLADAQHELRTAFALRREYTMGWSLLVVSLRRYRIWWALWLAAGLALAAPSWLAAPFLLAGVALLIGGAVNEFLLRRGRECLKLLLVAIAMIAVFAYRLIGSGGMPAYLPTGLMRPVPRPALSEADKTLVAEQCPVESRSVCLMVVNAELQAHDTFVLPEGRVRRSKVLLVDTILANRSDLDLRLECSAEDAAGELHDEIWPSASPGAPPADRLAPGEIRHRTIHVRWPDGQVATKLHCRVYRQKPTGNASILSRLIGLRSYTSGPNLVVDLPVMR